MIFEIFRGKLHKVLFLLFLISFDTISSNTNTDEIELGREIIARYLGAAPLIKDRSSLNYINSLGQYLIQSLPPEERDRKWFFGVLETDSVNAFAAPGGYVLITKGLFDLLKSEDQIAFVLAHEISHVVKKHHIKVINDQRRMEKLISSMQEKISRPNELLSDMGTLFKDFATKGLDKSAEHEADLDGAILAARAGFNSFAGHEVLLILSEFYARGNEAELFFKTHPHPLRRINMLNEQLPAFVEDYGYDSRPSSSFKELRK